MSLWVACVGEDETYIEIVGQLVHGEEKAVERLRDIRQNALLMLGRILRGAVSPKGHVCYDPRGQYGQQLFKSQSQPLPCFILASKFLETMIIPVPYKGRVQDLCQKIYSGIVLPTGQDKANVEKSKGKKILVGPGHE